ncbi:hypothetical protein AXY43_03705 [Clostridium sp. MF28]|uniref:AAA family ATPase n=1 Tax=Clostridium TaxID=1485 RepID=UPI000CF878D8|nr:MULTISPECIES: AAA family ATPase [Clostridium]AVK47197.1 hypothetical protein AXY43_03705 [Clostridium sp. MF28]PSM56431.1 hypothetical protein C4L39_17660 [Clostridium diolis]
MLDTLSSYIIHQFIKGICGMIDDNNSKQNNNNNKEVDINFSNKKHIEFLNNLKIDKFIQSNSEHILGVLSNKKNEYENLMKVIDYYKKDIALDMYSKLICISRYLYSRMESTIGLGDDSRYQIATEEFLEALNSLREFYFHKKYISIKCNSEIDKALIKAFQIYDNYLNNEYSDITMRFKIKYLNLSEGEKNFLNLLAKIFDIVTRSKENQLSIILLDEPDQSLHPEWSRQFIKFLCDEIEQYKNRKIQIVLSTHSPFMTTDIMSEHIYCLEKISETEDNNKKEKSDINIVSMDKKSDKIHNTFGANIYEVLKDSFILEKTIGAFSYGKIIELINDLKNDLENHDMGYEKFLINSIGELPLRKKLEYMYRQNREKCSRLKDSLLEQIKIETDEEKLDKIKKILNGDII